MARRSLKPSTYQVCRQVEALGGTTSSQRTAQETDQARFWADSTGTWTPSGQWLNLSDVVAQTTI
jgi:hypothetical protein